MLADAYSTAVFVMGEHGVDFLKKHHLDGLVIFQSKDSIMCRRTKGFLIINPDIDCKDR